LCFLIADFHPVQLGVELEPAGIATEGLRSGTFEVEEADGSYQKSGESGAWALVLIVVASIESAFRDLASSMDVLGSQVDPVLRFCVAWS
jgi:hypothetical protein